MTAAAVRRVDPLWARLEAYSPDDPTAALPFSARLARENGWSRDHARRVVEEYKRFCYLAMTAGHTVTPSDAVDQVWHLHLTYTRDYWGRFCPDVLGGKLHHGPTRGGAEESAKYDDLYARTVATYAASFGAAPPGDIWPDPAARAGTAAAFQRIDRSRVWIVPRLTLRDVAVATVLAAVIAGYEMLF